MKAALKKLLALSLISITMFTLVACGGNKKSDTTDATSEPQTSETTEVTTEPTTEETQVTEEAVQIGKFQQFENGLTSLGISFEVNEKAADMVGAKEGYGYLFEDGSAVELYLFDTNTDAYKEAFKNNQLYLEAFGMTMDVTFNDDLCIFFNDELANQADIENIFYNIK